MNQLTPVQFMKKRFRGLLPIVVDFETGGTRPETDAVLEVAAVFLQFDENLQLIPDGHYHQHIKPFEGARIDPEALAINQIIPDHPFRFAVDEPSALRELFEMVGKKVQANNCQRAVLVGHNAWFDLLFLKAATTRANIEKMPFHQFTCFDTATLGGLCLKQTVLARAVLAAGLPFDKNEAHSALYDARVTADLFCSIVNQTPILAKK